MHSIIITDWQTHSQALAQIRIQVFIEEQQVPVAEEWDGLDETATHFLVIKDTQAIACARLLIDTHQGKVHFHIGRVAVLKPYRAQGIGHALIEFVLKFCRDKADHPVYLHAQTERQRFYEQLGFAARGVVFMDAGIPHITMHWQAAE